MTEVEWLSCESPNTLLASLRTGVSERKLRLFSLRCLRGFSARSDTGKEEWEKAITIGEDYVDGKIELMHIDEMDGTLHVSTRAMGLVTQLDAYWGAAFALAFWSSGCKEVFIGGELFPAPETLLIQANVLRDIFPFRPITLSPSWLTSTVLALATGIYQDRAFDRMPILADALQDSGCSNEDILNHCRQPGEHVRGCFAVDLILGRF
jgi:hypothetical protein